MKTFEKAGYSRNWGLIRFLCALAVIFSHAFSLTEGSPLHEPLDRLTGGALSIGGLAVSFFFCMGGFLIAASLQKRNDVKGYFKARFLRIFPPLWLVVVLCVSLLWLISSVPANEYFTSGQTYRYLLNGLLLPVHELPGVFESNPYDATVNGALWTLPVEFACYIAAFLFSKAGLLKEKRFPFTLLLPAAALVIRPYLPGVLGGAVRPCILFWLGMGFFVYRSRIPAHPLPALLSLALLAASFCLKCPDPGLYLFFPYLLFYLAFCLPQVPAFLADTGKLSYSLYLWGFPIQQVAVFFLSPMKPWQNFLLSSVVACALALVTYLLTEKPLEKKKSEKTA